MKCPAPRAGGFTLIELMVAISLLSIVTGMVFSFYSFVDKEITKRGRKNLEFDSAMLLMRSVGNNIMKSKGTILLEESQWIFLNPRGDTARYEFIDGELSFKELPIKIGNKKISSFSFSCFGIDTLVEDGPFSEVDFNELDTDGNGAVEGKETQNIAWIQAKLSFASGEADSLVTLESVKNNLNVEDGKFLKSF